MKILFVCTGNTCRSPMAEALAKSIFPEKEFEIFSAGVSAPVGSPASENAVIVSNEMGLDLSIHKATQLTPKMIDEADLVLTMTQGHKHVIASACGATKTPIFTLPEYVGEAKEVIDPYGYGVDVYRRCIVDLKNYIEKLYKILI